MTYWETAEERNPAAPEYVLEFARIWTRYPSSCTRRRSRRSRETRLSRGDPVQEVQALKQQDGGPIAVGGATLAAA